MTDTTATADDLARDLLADLGISSPTDEEVWALYEDQVWAWINIAKRAWPAAIRCALAARAAITDMNAERNRLIEERDHFRDLWKQEQQNSQSWVEAYRKASNREIFLLGRSADILDALRDLLAACRHNRDSVGERVLDAMDRAEEVLG